MGPPLQTPTHQYGCQIARNDLGTKKTTIEKAIVKLSWEKSFWYINSEKVSWMNRWITFHD